MFNERGGYCYCGCGMKTAPVHVDRKKGRFPGDFNRYIRGHFKPYEPSKKGNYYTIGKRYEHRMIAEKALGKPLPEKAIVHHYSGYGDDSKNRLVICQDIAYHKLIHRREAALKDCGNPNFRKCGYCHQYDDPINLYISKNGENPRHRRCQAEWQKNRIKKLNEKNEFAELPADGARSV